MKIFYSSLFVLLSFSSTVHSAEDLAAAAIVPPAVSEAASTPSSNADSNESSFDKAKALQQYVELNSKTVPGIAEKTTHSELLSILSAAGKSMNVPEVGQVILTSANPECKAIVTPNATQVWTKAVLADVPDVSEMIGTYLCQGITAGYTPVDEVTLKAFADKASMPGVMKGADGKDYTVPAASVTVVKSENGMAHLTIAATSGDPMVTMVKAANADQKAVNSDMQSASTSDLPSDSSTTVTGKPMPSVAEQDKMNPVPADFVASSTFPADAECNGKDPDSVYDWRYFNCHAADPRFTATVNSKTRITAANAVLKAESQKTDFPASADIGNIAYPLGSK